MDIVKRLRDPQYDCSDEAADEIERLRTREADLLAGIEHLKNQVRWAADKRGIDFRDMLDD